jgi:hypothetical protein
MKPDRLRDALDPVGRLARYLAADPRAAERVHKPLVALAFGGSPTIARVAATGLRLPDEEGTSPVPRGVDLCFDLVGGRFHDLAGPVALVRAAGGVAWDLNGKDLDLKLPTAQGERDARHPFVIAATPTLAREFLEVALPGALKRHYVR